MSNLVLDLLADRAKNNPMDLAFAAEGVEINFRSLHANVKKIASKLRELGIEKGALVATALPTRLDWPFTLALMHEGVTSASIMTANPVPDGLNPSWLITLQPKDNFPLERTILISDEWLSALQETPETFAAASIDKADIVRVSTTSGTTGIPKIMEYPLSNIEARFPRWDERRNEELIRMTFIGLPSSQALWRAIECLYLGSPYICFLSTNPGVPKELARLNIEEVSGTAGQIFNLFDAMEKAKVKFSRVKKVRIGGSATLGSLARAIKFYFPNATIAIGYASSESGQVAQRELNDSNWQVVGKVLPDSEVQAFSDSNEQLPTGQVGRLGLKSPIMIHEYRDNPAATEEYFINGWFFPGDIGLVSEDNFVTLYGRGAEKFVSQSGETVYLAQVDSIASNFAGVMDSAAFTFGEENSKLGLALKLDPRGKLVFEKLAVAVRSLGVELKPENILSVSFVPRTSAGKVDRQRLRESGNEILQKS